MVTTFDRQGIAVAEQLALRSRDESRKSGFYVLAPDGTVLARGCNQFVDGVDETTARKQRPAKYAYTEHAERNAIYGASRKGISLEGSTAYLNWYPCAECARALVLTGIKRLVCYEPDWTEERYGFQFARVILEEGGVEVDYIGQKVEGAR